MTCASQGGASGRSLRIEPGLFDFVKQSPVTDPQRPCRAHAIPARLLERFGDRCALSGLGRPSKRSEEHTSELQSHSDLVCRLLLEKKKLHRITGTPSVGFAWTVLDGLLRG